MKFSLEAAWKDATRLLRDNFGLLAVIAGVFYFLPYTAALLWIPGLAELTMGQFDPTSEAMQAMVNTMFADYWWLLVVLGLVQSIGVLAMLALLQRRANPTVGEAIQTGARSVLSYIGVQILQALLIALVFFLLIGLPIAAGAGAVAALTGIVAIAVTFYILTKLSLTAPVIAIDGIRNPIEAVTRSWQLTKGNSIRLFAYYVLLFIAYAVISLLVSLAFALLFALGGSGAQEFGQTISAGLMSTVLIIIFAAVLAAVHLQLTRMRAAPVEKTGADAG